MNGIVTRRKRPGARAPSSEKCRGETAPKACTPAERLLPVLTVPSRPLKRYKWVIAKPRRNGDTRPAAARGAAGGHSAPFGAWAPASRVDSMSAVCGDERNHECPGRRKARLGKPVRDGSREGRHGVLDVKGDRLANTLCQKRRCREHRACARDVTKRGSHWRRRGRHSRTRGSVHEGCHEALEPTAQPRAPIQIATTCGNTVVARGPTPSQLN